MRRAVLLAALASLLPALSERASASPVPMPVQVQLSLRTLVAKISELPAPTPDVSMLTTEPVARSE